jgi:hypothetical protein
MLSDGTDIEVVMIPSLIVATQQPDDHHYHEVMLKRQNKGCFDMCCTPSDQIECTSLGILVGGFFSPRLLILLPVNFLASPHKQLTQPHSPATNCFHVIVGSYHTWPTLKNAGCITNSIAENLTVQAESFKCPFSTFKSKGHSLRCPFRIKVRIARVA